MRISGPRARQIGRDLCGFEPPPRQARLAHFLDAQRTAIDHGLVLCFHAPASFTGEDVVELHGHGGPVVMNLLLKRVLALGARAARPGEFSERAFLNDKIDLAQAEAIADLIASTTEAAARAAQRSLEGLFSRAVHGFHDHVVALRVYVEAAIDFPDEEVDFLSDGVVAQRLEGLAAELAGILDSARQGALLRDGLSIALVGRPNAGKSSLLNALSGRDVAIVTQVPGTTRDVLREQIHLDGIPLHLIDTAGLRETADEVEREGVRRARDELEKADLVLLVIDHSNPEAVPFPDLLERPNVTIVHNKIDLTAREPAITEQLGRTTVYLSVKTGAGMDLLHDHLRRVAGTDAGLEGTFLARTRHLDALHRARHHLRLAGDQLAAQAGELAAEELRLVQQAVNEITGEFTSDDLLGAIFSSFCIGK